MRPTSMLALLQSMIPMRRDLFPTGISIPQLVLNPSPPSSIWSSSSLLISSFRLVAMSPKTASCTWTFRYNHCPWVISSSLVTSWLPHYSSHSHTYKHQNHGTTSGRAYQQLYLLHLHAHPPSQRHHWMCQDWQGHHWFHRYPPAICSHCPAESKPSQQQVISPKSSSLLLLASAATACLYFINTNRFCLSNREKQGNIDCVMLFHTF